MGLRAAVRSELWECDLTRRIAVRIRPELRHPRAAGRPVRFRRRSGHGDRIDPKPAALGVRVTEQRPRRLRWTGTGALWQFPGDYLAANKFTEDSSMTRLAVALPALTLAAAPAARAGIADSPIPLLGGQPTFHLYSVPGVMITPALDTFFACTSTSTAAIQVSVEVFGNSGGGPLNNAASAALTVPAGGTVIFATINAAGVNVDRDLGVDILAKGSARILSTSKSSICTAFAADGANSFPVSMT